MGGERIWLDVPFGDKDEAKAAGARWDPSARRWYAPAPGLGGLERWRALPPVPDLLPGEDRSFGQGLFVDLVPTSCWFTNVRSCVSQRDWERIRRMVTARAGHRCEACGAEAEPDLERWLEVHERWAYDEPARVQSLRRLICLCGYCHTTTHYGLAQVRGLEESAFAHLIAVTGMTSTQAHDHVQAAFQVWRTRSAATWSLDLAVITRAGVAVVRPPDASQRPHQAHDALPAKTSESILPPRSAARSADPEVSQGASAFHSSGSQQARRGIQLSTGQTKRRQTRWWDRILQWRRDEPDWWTP